MLLLIQTMTYPRFQLSGMAEDFKKIFLFFPHFALSNCISNINVVYSGYMECVQRNIYLGVVGCKKGDIYSKDYPGITTSWYYMIATGIVCCVILGILEYRILQSIIYMFGSGRMKKSSANEVKPDDDIAERKRLACMSENERKMNNLVLKNLTKYYGSSLAVDRVTLGIAGCEIFGLLGSNGCGKSSIFKMIVGENVISSGDIHVCGNSVKRFLSEVCKNVGYCPQQSALFNELTGAETMELFCRLRGIQTGHIAELREQFATELNFMQHINERVSEYSNGDQRKLNTAIALIGNPALICLGSYTSLIFYYNS